jgi:imidazole glycerol-phosphate synthase subunit HisH
MADVTLVHYGLGNIQAFAHIYQRLNISVDVAETSAQIEAATHLILPGVGAFDWAMARLDKSGLRTALDEAVLGREVPVLGVCVGMQMMAESSDEGRLPGLGWVEANVERFFRGANTHKPLPHMGWNDVAPKSATCLFAGMENPRFYHLHSYFIAPKNDDATLATADYDGIFTAAIRKRNVFGTQFHPEKSHQWGIDLLRNFAKI